ncbi:MAG: TraR/DksA family transcriptional regulator [Chlamydiae bacterium]|jgi:DnaK suppressor protein|nr:TraR/DksA family transcriptional regulator [Chlamydiota bacterium]
MSLSKSEIEDFKKQLLNLKKQFQTSFEGTASDVKSSDDSRGSSQHHADEGTEDFDRTISIEIASKGIDVIKQIDYALEKIEEGTYGICEITGEPIPKKRLEAIPYASMTREAQEKFEKGLI